MVIQSDVKRLWWRIFFVGIVVDLIIAWAVVWLFDKDSSGKLLAIGLVWLALQALSILMSLRGLLCAVATFKLGQSKVIEDHFLAGVEQSKFPRPRDFETSVSDYLERIADDEELGSNTRVKAALMLGSKLTIGECLGLVRTSLIDSAQTRGLKRYHQLYRT